MAIVIFTQPVPFPIAPLRQALAAQLPLYRWQVGEEDDGGAQTMGRWGDCDLVYGRTGASAIFCELRARDDRLSGDVPLHSWHLEIRRPTTENAMVADRIAMVIATIVMVPDDGALCQLVPGGGWLSSEDMLRATRALLAGETLERLAEFGRPASSFAGRAAAVSTLPATPARTGRYAGLSQDQALSLGSMDESMARILHEKGMGDIADGMGLTKPPAFAHELPQADRLPTMVMLASAPLILDWALLREGLEAVDPRGGWVIDQSGPHHGVLRGRGATMTLDTNQSPLPGYLLAQATARSHGLSEEDKRLLGTHRVHHSIAIDLDTRAADFIDVRQTAKAATLLIALAAKRNGFVGLFNAGVGTVMPVARVVQQIGILGSDEVPITLWTWAAFHSTQADAISISTGGMLPFTGYEVELWNAPGTLETVAERLNGVLRYLLINGPAIAHGDTIGDHAADRSTRCFLGDSRADRGERADGRPVPAMLLEFDAPEAAGARSPLPRPDLPRPDLPRSDLPTATAMPVPPARPAPVTPTGFGRRPPGGFGRKGL